MIPLSSKRLNNLVAMIIGIIISKTVVLSEIAQELKDSYSSGTEESKIKRLQRFLSNKSINPEKLKWKYCIRCTKDLCVTIKGKLKIKKLEDIKALSNKGKNFYNIKLTAQNYNCNLSVCKAKDAEETWFIVHNLEKSFAIREYKKRFQIEEMFKDFKSGGFNLESTWSMNIQYIKMLYFCISIAYCFIITLGISCGKDKNNTIIGVIKDLNGKKVRIYSLFRAGLKWFKRCYYSKRNEYYLKFCFTLYES
ncbi:putative transposase [Clostridium botulinum E1 str. 'BoNT E Beluga']|nr:putative transposase [Clostridium botulinum E1 str. 'BoNT E Beluga']